MAEAKTKLPMLSKSYVSGQSEFSIPLEAGQHTVSLEGYGARLKRTLDPMLKQALINAGGLSSAEQLITSDEVAEKIVNSAKVFGKTAFDVLWQFGYFDVATTGETFKTGIPKNMPKPDVYEVIAAKKKFKVKDAKGDEVERETMGFEVVAKVAEIPANSNAQVIIEVDANGNPI